MPNVRVRIGVAVDDAGKWSAVGWNNMDTGDIYPCADGLSANVRYFWLEADLPCPTIEKRNAKELVEFDPR